MSSAAANPTSATAGAASATARERLLQAGMQRIRAQGFAATSVDELCADAGVTKGAFFHHFPSKEGLGVALAEYWKTITGAFFARAAYHRLADPVARVLGYIDLRIELVSGPPERFSCVAGTLLQENFASSAPIRAACADSILSHAGTLEADIAAALAARKVTDADPASLARYLQTVTQGAFVLAKTADPEHAAARARESLGHLRRYFELLLGEPRSTAQPSPTTTKGHRA